MQSDKKKFYFLGIGGLGMSSVAGLLKQAGHEVTGSDVGMSDPVKEALSFQGISFKQGYFTKNIEEDDSDIDAVDLADNAETI